MTFTPEIYERIRAGCIASAQEIVPILEDIFEPTHVYDIGGGEGWWLQEFHCPGTLIDKSVGIDLFDWLRSDGVPDRIEPGGLVLCLEVAEHLPEHLADQFVAGLTRLGLPVVFSAAIPGQGGHGHLNEQWPSYWVHKFETERGYLCSDELRWMFWTNENIEPWYRQNMLIFAPRQKLADLYLEISYPKNVVHPEIFGWKL
jgi:hypothetical protein